MDLGASNGTVRSFDGELGMGTIIDIDGREWSFHCTTIADGSRTIDVGVSVSFEIRPGGPGRWEAFAVATL